MSAGLGSFSPFTERDVFFYVRVCLFMNLVPVGILNQFHDPTSGPLIPRLGYPFGIVPGHTIPSSNGDRDTRMSEAVVAGAALELGSWW